MIHDLDIAFTVWGFLDPVAARRARRTAPASVPVGVAPDPLPRTAGDRAQVPEETLRMTPDAVRAAYPARWSVLIGLVAANQP